MTLAEWSQAVIAELAAAGFDAELHGGFPLVKMPQSMSETVKLLKLKLSVSTQWTIYKEGMLITPAGIDPTKEPAGNAK